MRLVATKQIVVRGRRVMRGQEFDARRSQARVFLAIGSAVPAPPVQDDSGYVSDCIPVVTPEPTPEPGVAPEQPKQKRAYKRRDMKAEG